MIDGSRKKVLVAKAEALAADLARFQTQGSGDSVDPSRVAEVQRFVAANGTADLVPFLERLPGSYLRDASRSAPPQLEEVKRRVLPLARELRDPEEMSYVLGWARRLLSMAEKKGSENARPRQRPGRR